MCQALITRMRTKIPGSSGTKGPSRNTSKIPTLAALTALIPSRQGLPTSPIVERPEPSVARIGAARAKVFQRALAPAEAGEGLRRAIPWLDHISAGLDAESGKPALNARIGIETGPVVVDAMGEIYGDAPNAAARVQALAEPGTVVVTAQVRRQNRRPVRRGGARHS